ncbi:hypothetical protein L1049_025652 [Liquidambar formosana]|uniref:Uncharacterized protein n=1 Tax=Liquidambar formosana TaxID=63359 RepID=A0AAP0NBW1_LIQFO
MVGDILLQIGLILATLFMFLVMYGIPQKALSKIRFRNRATFQAKRHFVQGAQLLARARSAKTPPSETTSFAQDALAEAEKAISLDPKDAASHILKALVLDLQGYKTSALDSLDAALSPLAVKSLSDQEKGDALLRRAELKVAVSGRGRVDSAVADLVAGVKLSKENAKGV